MTISVLLMLFTLTTLPFASEVFALALSFVSQGTRLVSQALNVLTLVDLVMSLPWKNKNR